VSEDKQQSLPPWVAGVEHRMHELDPELTDSQIEIIKSYGHDRSYKNGDIVWNAGDRNTGLTLVMEGQLEILDGERIIITHGPGHYGGEIVTMAGRGALVGGRAKGATRVCHVSTPKLKELLSLEPELGEILLTSFIVRRMRMLAENQGLVRLYGIAEESGTAHLRTFLSRQGIPHELIDLSDGGSLPEETNCTEEDIPVLTVGDKEFCSPSIREVAEHLNIAAELEPHAKFDLCVIGAGPSGLAAAVYGASEGLSVVVIETMAPGGQAGTSSRIENYLGFPTGISGQGLAGRAFLQATKFGAELAMARTVERLEPGPPHRIHLDGGDCIEAKSIVIASGAIYRTPPVENLEQFSAGGVHYGASYIEARLCQQKDVAIVGGGNSAGQAAIYLAEYARSVKIMIRNGGLESSMSSYLINRIDNTHNIEVVPHTEVVSANGDLKLNSLTLQNTQTGEKHEQKIPHLFIFIGAVPSSDFAEDIVRLDNKGFILTGESLNHDCLVQFGWPLERKPYRLETTVPGIFAVGDVRAGSVKRVAAAVGEGSTAIQDVHQYIGGQGI